MQKHKTYALDQEKQQMYIFQSETDRNVVKPFRLQWLTPTETDVLAFSLSTIDQQCLKSILISTSSRSGDDLKLLCEGIEYGFFARGPVPCGMRRRSQSR